jgi:hypothetical protein
MVRGIYRLVGKQMTKLLESLQKSKWQDSPWDHFIIENILTDEQVDEIRNASVTRDGVLHDGTRSGYKQGVEKQNHKLREYITKDNYQKYPELTKFINELRSRPVREHIAKMIGNESINLGTDLYNEDLELVKTVPFWHNYGYIFHGPNKWHGMNKGKQIKVERRGIQLNYVTFQTDWPVYED